VSEDSRGENQEVNFVDRSFLLTWFLWAAPWLGFGLLMKQHSGWARTCSGFWVRAVDDPADSEEAAILVSSSFLAQIIWNWAEIFGILENGQIGGGNRKVASRAWSHPFHQIWNYLPANGDYGARARFSKSCTLRRPPSAYLGDSLSP